MNVLFIHNPVVDNISPFSTPKLVKLFSWQRNTQDLRQLIRSLSVLQEQILTVPSRGGRQTQDICFSASRRHGRDFDTGCQGNLTRQASCFIRAFKKCAAVALARVFRTSFCLLLDCYALRRWRRMSCKPDERGSEGKRRTKRERERERGGIEESDPWPLRPCDVSRAGRGRNWEWHSWLELPNCHFLSSLFTHSGSLSWTFEERRTDMCLLVPHRFWLSLLWFTTTPSTSQSNKPSAEQRRAKGAEGKWKPCNGSRQEFAWVFFL